MLVERTLSKPLNSGAETLWVVSENPYLEDVSIPVKMKHFPFHLGRGLGNQLATQWSVGHLNRWCHIRGSKLLNGWTFRNRINRSALMSGPPCRRVHAQPYSLLPWSTLAMHSWPSILQHGSFYPKDQEINTMVLPHPNMNMPIINLGAGEMNTGCFYESSELPMSWAWARTPLITQPLPPHSQPFLKMFSPVTWVYRHRYLWGRCGTIFTSWDFAGPPSWESGLSFSQWALDLRTG